MHVGMLNQFHEGELRGAADGYKQVELAFGRAYLCKVDVKILDWIPFKFLPAKFAPFHFWQATDVVLLQATMQRRTSQPGNCDLQGIQTIVEW